MTATISAWSKMLLSARVWTRSTMTQTTNPVTRPKASASNGMGIPLRSLRVSDRLLIFLVPEWRLCRIITPEPQITKPFYSPRSADNRGSPMLRWRAE